MNNVTTIIRQKKDKFKKKIKYPEIKEKDIKYYNSPKNHSLIGYAYEVLFQLKYLRKHNSKNVYILKAFKKRDMLMQYHYIKRVRKILVNLALIEKRIYLGKETLKDVLYLANVGLIRKIKEFNIEINKEDIKDLKALKKGLKDFKDILEENLSFNVYVEKGNVKGEIDIIGDDFIIDIKTVKDFKITEYQINQLLSYSLLLNKKIKKIGILFSRFGKVKFFKVKDLISEKRLSKLGGVIQKD